MAQPPFSQAHTTGQTQAGEPCQLAQGCNACVLHLSDKTTSGQTDGYTDRQTSRQTDGQTDRRTDRQIDRQTYKQTERERQLVPGVDCSLSCELSSCFVHVLAKVMQFNLAASRRHHIMLFLHQLPSGAVLSDLQMKPRNIACGDAKYSEQSFALLTRKWSSL